MEGAGQLALAGGVLALGLGVIIAAMVAAVIVGGIVLYVAAKIAGIRDSGFVWCCVVSLATLFVSMAVNIVTGLFVGWIPILGWLVMVVASVAASAAVIQAMMKTTFQKALVCELVRFVVSFMAMIGTGILMAGGAAALGAMAH